MAAIDKDILRLALPALGALIAEPVFLLSDTAMVGHLGAGALGSLAIASTILQTVLGLMVFLAYATTPRVAKRMGAGDRPGAITAGFDGIWLALCTSVLLVAIGLPLLSPVIAAFGPDAETAAGAHSYLAISWWGLPFMLTVVAATGLLRGLQDTKTPLIVAAAGCVANIGLNALFIYGFDMGVAGSALGTVIAQAGMCAVYLTISIRAAHRLHASVRPDWSGVFTSAKTSGWLLVRNASLRAALIILVFIATSMGTTELAAIQVAQSIFFALALALDSLAIAGQAMIGLQLGAGNTDAVAAINRRLCLWGIVFGVIVGVILLAGSGIIPRGFSSDPDVITVLAGLLPILALSMPIAGYVFVLDGVLMGAEDARYLALAQLIAVGGYALLLIPTVDIWPGAAGLWAAFSIGFVGLRAVTLGWRVRNRDWITRAVEKGIS
ncbi:MULTISPECIES: MATE family efflux transporter [unclassified Brevibacterium]|uniref:MATE family efflux transporter n=1 Tax=unclassified Brevibacterium TaxID=2614124 RepID=UPI001E4E03A5|nr:MULTISPECIES: MATE family efflux transporter [unclassified Brevibacterium]MCD1285209.1 MATE family efflux transporter [Brevibacterium sp. CCUG 69071]MDK8435168.1 MATE family efflux transporter [Brevibacterium sp. H-BE7]